MDGAMGSQATSPAIANHSHLTGLLYVAADARKPVTNTCDFYHSAARSRGIPPFQRAHHRVPQQWNRIPRDALDGAGISNPQLVTLLNSGRAGGGAWCTKACESHPC